MIAGQTLSFGSVAIDPELARQLKQAARKVAEWTELRNELIRQACNEGGSLREVGHVADLTHAGVKRILDRAKE